MVPPPGAARAGPGGLQPGRLPGIRAKPYRTPHRRGVVRPSRVPSDLPPALKGTFAGPQDIDRARQTVARPDAGNASGQSARAGGRTQRSSSGGRAAPRREIHRGCATPVSRRTGCIRHYKGNLMGRHPPALWRTGAIARCRNEAPSVAAPPIDVKGRPAKRIREGLSRDRRFLCGAKDGERSQRPPNAPATG